MSEEAKLLKNMFNFHYSPPVIIAEIGCNHMGNFELAKDMILLAKQCGADYAKFQKRNPTELLSGGQYSAPHPEPWQAYGQTYGEHREFLEFSIEQHTQLKDYAKKNNISYACSVWDLTSAKEIITLKPEYIKVPSACNTNYTLLKLLRDNFEGSVHVSIGMTTYGEIKNIVELFEETNAAKNRLTIYSCTSGYPISFNSICLMEIKKLYDNYGNRIKSIGFSGHHLGIAVDVAAYTLGAKYIERHFTKDRTFKGTDHAASLEITGLQKLVRDLHHTYEALRYKKDEIIEVELLQRNKLKYKG